MQADASAVWLATKVSAAPHACKAVLGPINPLWCCRILGSDPQDWLSEDDDEGATTHTQPAQREGRIADLETQIAEELHPLPPQLSGPPPHDTFPSLIATDLVALEASQQGALATSAALMPAGVCLSKRLPLSLYAYGAVLALQLYLQRSYPFALVHVQSLNLVY